MLWEEIHCTSNFKSGYRIKENVQVSRGLKVHGMVFNSMGDVNIIVEGGSKEFCHVESL